METLKLTLTLNTGWAPTALRGAPKVPQVSIKRALESNPPRVIHQTDLRFDHNFNLTPYQKIGSVSV
jgi:hypothetical protein